MISNVRAIVWFVVAVILMISFWRPVTVGKPYHGPVHVIESSRNVG